MTGKAPTLRDVARAAGVSIAVVSYAFNRPDRVASATRERVLAAAATLGYPGPHAAGRALRLGRHGAVALVGRGSTEVLLADPAAALVARGLARVCDRAGHALLLGGTPNGAADGTVVLGDARGWSGGGPAVAVGGPAPEGVPCVRARLREGAAEAARHLVGLGHARLAVIGPPGTGERLRGASEGWGATGPLVSYEAAGPARADGDAAARVALGARPRPTALLALTDRLAWGALDAARHLGIEVPRELSVAGIDDLAGSQAARLTSVFVPYLPMGELAGGLLAALMAGGALPPAPPLPTTLAVRGTTAPPPGSGGRRAGRRR
jgi:DNA-binding LacI/PurR family transcriptional regulator